MECMCSPRSFWFVKTWRVTFEFCFVFFLQYLCFCLVLVLSTYTWSSRGKGFSIAWGRGPQWTSLHTALSAPVRGQGSDAMMVLLSKTNFIRKLLNELCSREKCVLFKSSRSLQNYTVKQPADKTVQREFEIIPHERWAPKQVNF